MTGSGSIKLFSLASLLAILAIVAAAASDARRTAFPVDVPNNAPVVSLPPGLTLCQGPVDVQSRFQAVEIWVRPAARLQLTIRAAGTERVLARTATAMAPHASGAHVIKLKRTATPAGQPIDVCLRNVGQRAVTFEGGPPSRTSGRLAVGGRPRREDIAMLFLRDHGSSLLSLLPAVFDRASLFKLAGVGAWTFWLLLAGCLVAFPLAAVALASALKSGAPGEFGCDQVGSGAGNNPPRA